MSRHITIYRVISVNWHHGAGHGWKQHPYESSVCSITYANNADSWAEMTPAPCFPSPVQMAIKRRKCPFFQKRRYLELFQMSIFFFLCFWPKLALQWLQAGWIEFNPHSTITWPSLEKLYTKDKINTTNPAHMFFFIPLQLNIFSLFLFIRFSFLFVTTSSHHQIFHYAEFCFLHISESTKQMHLTETLLRSLMKPVIMLNTKQQHIREVRHQTITQSPILLLS